MNSKKIKWNLWMTQDNSVMIRKYTYQNVRGSLGGKIIAWEERVILITTFKSVFSVKKVKMIKKHHMRNDWRN